MSDPRIEIRITGLDTDLTQESPTIPGNRLMYLSLSDIPPDVWCKIFRAERQYPRHSKWRHAWIEGDNVVVDCPPEELEQHLDELKHDVASCNAKFQQFVEDETRRQKAGGQAAQQERERLEQVKNRLKF